MTTPSDPNVHSPDGTTDFDATHHGWQVWHAAGHPCDVYQPAEMNPHGYALIYLHDANEVRLADRKNYERQFDEQGLRVIAPRGGRCWWSDRETSQFQYTNANGEAETAEQYICQSLLGAIESQFQIAPPQVGLFGIGMGGQGALRISYRHPNLFPVVVGVASDLDYQYRVKEGDEVLFDIYGDTESARQDTAILYIHPLNWPRHQFFCADPDDLRTFEAADRLRMKMSSIGIMFEADLKTKWAKSKTSADYAEQMADKVLEFLVERLNKERLRVV